MLSPVKTVEIFQTSPEPQQVRAGDTIFTTGEAGTVLYGLLEGRVEIWVEGKVLETIESGDIFGEGALVHPDCKRASTAIAKTDCKLAVMGKNNFLFAIEIMRSYSDRIRRLRTAIASEQLKV